MFNFKKNAIIFQNNKEIPTVSVVFFTKNNEKLLEYACQHLLDFASLKEIIVLDLGSIDKTLQVASRVLAGNPQAKIVSITERDIAENTFQIAKKYASGEIVYILQLDRIGTENPQLYIPDIFQPLQTILEVGCPDADSRIDGCQLLYLDAAEREKNSLVLKDHVIEPLANLYLRIEALREKVKLGKALKEEELAELGQYLDSSLKDITLLVRLLGPVTKSSDRLEDNMLVIFKDYGYSHKVKVSYHCRGKKRELKTAVNELLLNVIQDFLYTVIQGNLTTELWVNAHFTQNHYRLYFTFTLSRKTDLLNPENGLSYFVLRSVHNRLSLLGGKLHLKTNNKREVTLSLELPLNSMTLDG